MQRYSLILSFLPFLAITFGEIVTWLIDHWNQVVNVVSNWYGKIARYVIDWYNTVQEYVDDFRDRANWLFWLFWGHIQNLASEWYGALADYAVDWYNRISEYITDFRDRANWLFWLYWGNATNLIQDWYTKISTYVIDWYNRISEYITDFRERANWLFWLYWGHATNLIQDWYTKITTYVIDWYDRISEYITDFRERANWLFWLYWGHLQNLVHTFYSNIMMLAYDYYSMLAWLVVNGWATLVHFINDQAAALEQYIIEFESVLSSFARNYYQGLVNIMQNPVRWIAGIMVSIFWPFTEWVLASLLGGVNYQVPPPPDFIGGDSPPPIPGPPPPPGSGLIAWPCSTHTRSGYDYTPPTHYGIDLGEPSGGPIWACGAGTCVVVSYSEVGYGHRVDIQHDDGFWTRYAHMSTLYVTQGQDVDQGQTIGLCDNTGNSSGAHLHFEVKQGGAYVNPWTVLPPA